MSARSHRILAALFLGPITGPLAIGAISCARQGRWAMATVYGLGVVEVAIGLPALLHWMLTAKGVAA